MKPRVLKNSKGFSLIEVMVVVGIVAVIGLASSSLMVSTMREQKKSSILNEYNSKVHEIGSVVSSSNICTASFKPYIKSNWSAIDTSAGYDLPAISAGSGVILATGASYSGMKVTSIKLKKVSLVVSTGTTETYLLQLDIQTDNVDTSLGGVGKRKKTYLIMTTVDTTKDLLNCYDSSANTSTLIASCSALGGTYTETPSPSCSLTSNAEITNITNNITNLDNDVTQIETFITNIDGSCPSGQAISGINPDGTKICSSITGSLSCPSGTFLTGFVGSTPTCAVPPTSPPPALPPSTPPPVPPATPTPTPTPAGPGTAPCTDPATGIMYAHGSVVVMGPYVTATCNNGTWL